MARSHIAYAHIPGQGPASQCSLCAHWHPIPGDVGWGRCAEAARMAHLALSQVQPAATDTPACRYWTGREDTAS
ncbi:hypothetical protein [Roseospira goensis]|uniref:Uncharacterized protein n=1 Tax=Roseospira goensis TaxID=391922 RepID=A0A7W6S410_9PROT|nr:hypothetical protein [Roseospira goensis]MBB4287724.1 hypothetical protein [Roseospira goensis]